MNLASSDGMHRPDLRLRWQPLCWPLPEIPPNRVDRERNSAEAHYHHSQRLSRIFCGSFRKRLVPEFSKPRIATGSTGKKCIAEAYEVCPSFSRFQQLPWRL